MGRIDRVRFLRARRRTATCTICWCHVSFRHLSHHAIYHSERGEGQERKPGLHIAHNDLTVIRAHPDGKPYVVASGWVTENAGPR